MRFSLWANEDEPARIRRSCLWAGSRLSEALWIMSRSIFMALRTHQEFQMAIDFQIPAEAQAIREKVRQWVHDECIPAEKELEQGRDFQELLAGLRAKIGRAHV